MTGTIPKISVLITTRNRRDDVLMAVESCLAQDYPEIEILVYDDASEDDTVEALRRAFPQVKVFKNPRQRERLELRNEGFATAQGEFVVMLDDDCYLTENQLFRRVADFLSERPKTAAACIPMIEPSRPRNYMPVELEEGAEMGSFLAGASAFRREAILGVGGYRELLVRHEEERDLALRMLDAGWGFHYLGGAPIVHTVSPRRPGAQTDLYGIRNIVLVWFLNLPLRVMPGRILISSFNVTRYRLTLSSLPPRLRGLLWGFASCWRYRRERRPVRLETYRRHRLHTKHGPVRVADHSTEPLRLAAAAEVSQSP